ncbi:MAG TPA: hypothetical protein VLZ81_18200, partial [Blastocatellia bacterium]|nr:hypothetical protein [Blastocatellia bacterium]
MRTKPFIALLSVFLGLSAPCPSKSFGLRFKSSCVQRSVGEPVHGIASTTGGGPVTEGHQLFLEVDRPFVESGDPVTLTFHMKNVGASAFQVRWWSPPLQGPLTLEVRTQSGSGVPMALPRQEGASKGNGEGDFVISRSGSSIVFP